MPIPVLDVPMPTFEQSAPWLEGMRQAQNVRQMQLQAKQMQIQNEFARPMLEQKLLEATLNNKMLQPKSEMAPQFAQADLQKTLSDALLAQQQAQYYGPQAQINIAKGQFGLQNPLLSQPGTAGQIGALGYMMQHPEQFKDQDYTIKPDQYERLATGVNSSGGNAQSPAGETNELPNQQGSLLDTMRQSIFGSLNEQKAKTNYYNLSPAIRAAQNPILQAAAGNNPEVAKAAGNSLMKAIDPSVNINNSDVKHIQSFLGDLNTKKTTTEILCKYFRWIDEQCRSVSTYFC
jgi:hypothetical protein